MRWPIPLITFASTGHVNLSGLWLNDRLNAGGGEGASPLMPAYIDGGTASLASGQIVLAPGSTIDVSGGGRLSSDRKFSAGNAGKITLRAGLGASDPEGYRLELGASLRGYSAGKGGSLDITAYTIRIANAASGADGELWLKPSFFQEGGFSQYNLSGDFGLEVAAGTAVHPLAQTLVLDPARAMQAPGVRSINGVADLLTLPVELRNASSIALRSTSALNVGTGASITTDPRGVISLAGSGSLAVDGTLEAPAGSITLMVSGDDASSLTSQGLQLGANTRLLARGAFLQAQKTVLGLVTGDVLRGGQITLQATGTQLVTNASSLMDVSGISQAIDITAGAASPRIISTLVHGDAGGITIKGTDNMRIEGRMAGNAGATAAGGSFALESQSSNPLLFNVQRIVLTQAPTSWTAPTSSLREAYLPLSTLADGGFDKLRFKSGNEIEFRGDVTIDAARGIRLEAPLISAQGANAVKLSGGRVEIASYVGIDPTNPLSSPSTVVTAPGPAIFDVSAGLIDLFGTVALNGFSQINLTSASDIRGTGKPVDSNTNDLIFKADRLVGGLVSEGSMDPRCAAGVSDHCERFHLRVDHVDSLGTRTQVDGGSITIERASGKPGAVLSAGGSITFDADTVEQNGIVMAPLGTIAINAGSEIKLGAGSVTSVSAAGLTLPFGTTVNGQSWVYDDMIALSTPPSKRIALNSTDVAIGIGAVLDVSGGGELQAIEFVPGIGGSKDTLLAGGTYAIVPTASLQYAPYDSHIAGLADLGFGKDSNIYDSVLSVRRQWNPGGAIRAVAGFTTQCFLARSSSRSSPGPRFATCSRDKLRAFSMARRSLPAS